MKVMSQMEKEYGEKKGKNVFYASMNKNKKGSSKWHKKKSSKDNYSHSTLQMAQMMREKNNLSRL